MVYIADATSSGRNNNNSRISTYNDEGLVDALGQVLDAEQGIWREIGVGMLVQIERMLSRRQCGAVVVGRYNEAHKQVR